MKALIIFLMMVSRPSFGQSAGEAHFVKVNGVEVYYEVYGAGPPLLLLHGWTQSSQFWADYIPTYAPHFSVYAVDLRGHGRSAPLSADFSIKQAARDVAALLDHLEIQQASVIGLSFGGLVLLELAAGSPDRIKVAILIGAAHRYRGGENAEGEDPFTYDNLPAAYIGELRKLHHHGESQIRALFKPDLDYQINLGEAALRKMTFSTLIVHGDSDEILGIDPAIELNRNMPHSALWIVPNTGHLAIDGPNKSDFLTTSLRFLTSEKE